MTPKKTGSKPQATTRQLQKVLDGHHGKSPRDPRTPCEVFNGEVEWPDIPEIVEDLFRKSPKNAKRKTGSTPSPKKNGNSFELMLERGGANLPMEEFGVPKGQTVRHIIRDAEGNIFAIFLHSGPCVISTTTGSIL